MCNMINEEISEVKKIFTEIILQKRSIQILDGNYLPYGLKAHTRSISWIGEQFIIQQTKKYFEGKGVEVNIDVSDTCLHDCEIVKEGKTYYVNIKIHNIEKNKNKNDIAAVYKLIDEYKKDKNYRLIYVCFGIKFSGFNIHFEENEITVFSPQFIRNIYINKANKKLQAYYEEENQTRTREDFLHILECALPKQ